MEVKWSLRESSRDGENWFTLMMSAAHYIEVQGKRQLFRFSYQQQNPKNVEYAVNFFTDRAEGFFNSIEESLKPYVEPDPHAYLKSEPKFRV